VGEDRGQGPRSDPEGMPWCDALVHSCSRQATSSIKPAKGRPSPAEPAGLAVPASRPSPDRVMSMRMCML